MYEGIYGGITAISDILYRPWFVPLLLVIGGVYFTLRTKFMQIRFLGESFKVIMEAPNERGGTAFKCLDDYAKQKKAGKEPVFKAADIGLRHKTDYWN